MSRKNICHYYELKLAIPRQHLPLVDGHDEAGDGGVVAAAGGGAHHHVVRVLPLRGDPDDGEVRHPLAGQQLHDLLQLEHASLPALGPQIFVFLRG